MNAAFSCTFVPLFKYSSRHLFRIEENSGLLFCFPLFDMFSPAVFGLPILFFPRRLFYEVVIRYFDCGCFCLAVFGRCV